MAPPATTEAELRASFDVVEDRFGHGRVTLGLIRPRQADALIDEAAFAADERLPYWADLWPSAKALARWLIDGAGGLLSDRPRVMEVGCGVGLPSLALRAVGVDVLATDYYEEALRFAEVNAARNALPPLRTRLVDWRRLPADLGRFDLVLAADVLYEARHARDLAAALGGLVAPRGQAVVADPGRRYRGVLEDELRRRGWAVGEIGRFEEPAAGATASTITLISARPPASAQ